MSLLYKRKEIAEYVVDVNAKCQSRNTKVQSVYNLLYSNTTKSCKQIKPDKATLLLL